MKFFAALLFVPSLAFANFDNCQQFFPNDKPVARKAAPSEYELCNNGYAVLYEGDFKVPRATFTLITKTDLDAAKTLNRGGIEFKEDMRLKPEHRSANADYSHSGYDRGHQFPAGNSGSKAIMNDSFLLSNITPERPNLNREVKAKAEGDIRKYARRTGNSLYIAVGAAHSVDKCEFKIGRGVCVVDNPWIAVYDPLTGKSWAYWMHNTDGAVFSPPISVKDLETKIGYAIWELKK